MNCGLQLLNVCEMFVVSARRGCAEFGRVSMCSFGEAALDLCTLTLGFGWPAPEGGGAYIGRKSFASLTRLKPHALRFGAGEGGSTAIT